MRLRDIIICLFCVVVAAALFFAAETRLDYINAKRLQWKLISNEPLENAPPSLAFATIAMGAFRGLVVDVLWIRAERLKQEGQFFDAKQLAEWITTLQPRFTEVWAFQAWNMAYNISVAMPASQPDQRWHWVKNGYELLRDKAIPQNPKAIMLYRELAWIFLHKMGGITDDVHKYYKLQLSLAMRPLLEPATNDFFQTLADAPSRWNQILKDPAVAQFVGQLKTADSEFADDRGPDFTKRAKSGPSRFVSNYLSLRRNPARFKDTAFDVIDRFRGSEALQKFDTFAKAYQLRTVWKLDPALMHELNQTYGPADWNDPNTHLPLNWEHPATHAIYWAARGLQVAGKEEFTVDELSTDRVVYQSLQNLLSMGKVTIYSVVSRDRRDIPASVPLRRQGQKAGPLTAARTQAPQDRTSATAPPARTVTVFLRPDLRMFEPCNRSFLAKIEKTEARGESPHAQSIKNAHRHLLLNVVTSFYQAGHIPRAQKIYNQLRRLYPRDEFKVPLVVFVRNRLRKELGYLGIRDATEMILFLLRESYFRYAIRDDDGAFGREKMAEEIYQDKQKEIGDNERLKLPDDFGILRYLALRDFLADAGYPPRLREALKARIKIERPALAEQFLQRETKMIEKARQQGQAP